MLHCLACVTRAFYLKSENSRGWLMLHLLNELSAFNVDMDLYFVNIGAFKKQAKQVNMTRKCQNRIQQTTPRHHENIDTHMTANTITRDQSALSFSAGRYKIIIDNNNYITKQRPNTKPTPKTGKNNKHYGDQPTFAQSDQSLCWSLEYSTNIKLLTEHHLEFLS